MQPEKWIEICAQRTTEELFAGLKRLDGRESRALAGVLAHLAELDKRKAAEERGYPSLFVYCTRELGYSEAEAFLTIRTARAAANFPRILTMLARRQIHIGAVSKLYPHLRSENYRSLLDRASRRSLEELDRLLAELAPVAEKRPVIRTLSVATADTWAALDVKQGTLPRAGWHRHPDLSRPSANESLLTPPGTTSKQPDGATVATRNPGTMDGRVLFNFVGPERLRKKFARAKELMRHKYPYGLPEQIFEDALDALLDRKDPDRRIARMEARRNRAVAKRGLWVPVSAASAAKEGTAGFFPAPRT